MRPWPLLALLVLPLLAPAAHAAGSGVTTEMVVEAVDAQHARLKETLTETAKHFSPWTLPIPDGATLVGASDSRGSLAVKDNGDGTVTVTTPTRGVSLPYSFTVTFDKPFDAYGSLLHVFAQASGSAGDTSLVRAVIPAGWSVVGGRAEPDVAPDATGAFRTDGPISAGFAFAPPGVADPGVDPRAAGTGVFREGVANLTATGGTLDVTLVYDTDVYSSVSLLLPPGATIASASTPFGATTPKVTGSSVVLDHAYPVHAGLGGRPVTVRYQLPQPDAFGGAFLNATLNMAAGEDDNLTLDVHLADGLTFVGSRTRAHADASGLRFTAKQPFVVEIAYLDAVPAGSVRFAVNSTFVVQVPNALEGPARAVAADAAALLPQTSAFAGGDRLARPFYVTYTGDESLFTLFKGEQGFYTGGMNTITIRAADLANSSASHADFEAVSTLVHETTHGLVDRQVPDGYGNLSFFQEGLARLAENHLEKRFPDEVVSCSATQCTRASVRPSAADVQARYKAGTTFPITWSAGHAPESDIGFLYDDSGLIFRAYEERSDPQALGRALISLAIRGAGPTDDAEAQAVVDALLNMSPGMTSTSLLYPGKGVAALPADKFEACMGDLVRPRYPPPFEPSLPARPADCGDLPSATTESADAGAPPQAGDNFTLPTPPPPIPKPVAATPSAEPTPTEGAPATSGSEAPGATESPGNAPVPGLAPLLVVALVAALAWARRR